MRSGSRWACPGYAGDAKARWQATLDGRFGADGWRIAHIVRGAVVPRDDGDREYEAAVPALPARPARAGARSSPRGCGNVYDDNVTNVHDADYEQPHTAMNHYQDISVRRVIAELVDDPDWPDVIDTDTAEADLVDLGTGVTHRAAAGPRLPRRSACCRSASRCRPATA